MRPTVFHLLYVIAVIGSGLIGAQLGLKWFGDFGAAVAGVLGAVVGFAVSYVFYRLLDVLMVRSVRRKSTSVLIVNLVADDIPGTYVSGLIISVLLERGEPVDSFREYIFRQLHSGYVTWRKAGLYTLEVCYPELAIKLGEFNPFHPTADDLRRLSEIELISMENMDAHGIKSQIAVPYRAIARYSGLIWRAMPGQMGESRTHPDRN